MQDPASAHPSDMRVLTRVLDPACMQEWKKRRGDPTAGVDIGTDGEHETVILHLPLPSLSPFPLSSSLPSCSLGRAKEKGGRRRGGGEAHIHTIPNSGSARTPN